MKCLIFKPSRALLAALGLGVAVFVLRLCFIPASESLLLFNSDEAEMHEAALGPVLGTVPQRLIWPGGVMRHVALVHLGASAVLDNKVTMSPDGLAVHIGQVLLDPGKAWTWMRVFGAFGSAAGFAVVVWLVAKRGVPVHWALAIAFAMAVYPLHWMHGCMTTPDALAWGLALVALTLAWESAGTLWLVLASGVVAGLSVGSKMTMLPMVPALALVAVSRGHPVVRALAAWGCGLLLGLLLATPYFLADPVRLAKTMLGVVKFKPGDFTGLATTLRLMLGGIPVWLVVAGALAMIAAWIRRERVMLAGLVLSSAWMIQSAAGSKQVVERYFPPLGMVLFFAVTVLLLPWINKKYGNDRGGSRVVSCICLLLAGLSLWNGWKVMSLEHEAMVRRAEPAAMLAEVLKGMDVKRVALDSRLYGPRLSQLASAGSLDALAEHLEMEQVGHRSMIPTLSGFGFSHATIRVLGGLFDEVEVNQAARLRAMAAAATGTLELRWFFSGKEAVYGRLWKDNVSGVEASLQRGELDAVVFVGNVPPALASWPVTVIPAEQPLHLVRLVKQP
jgi:hypothetical protein